VENIFTDFSKLKYIEIILGIELDRYGDIREIAAYVST
jgi:hypothetical protein